MYRRYPAFILQKSGLGKALSGKSSHSNDVPPNRLKKIKWTGEISMAGKSGIASRPNMGIPPDDLQRVLILAQPDKNQARPHYGVVGDTYTILLSGDDTNGRFCLIDMHVPPGGGPPPHRHDFEETFIILEGELEATFRGAKSTVLAGETIHIPSNAPHQFHNGSQKPVRMLCICSPAGQEDFFMQIGVPVETSTTPPPKLSEADQKKLEAKMKELLPKFRTEMVKSA
jgi:quercetin dioxygenase-like cupin family protein